MEMQLKQSPSIDQDPQQKQLELQQRQLAMQQFLDQADLSKAENKIDSLVENKLDHYSPNEQKVLKAALARESVREGGVDADIRLVGVHKEAGTFFASVGEFDVAIIDLKGTLAKAKELVQSEAKPLIQENAELTPSRDMPQEITPEKDISNVLAQIEEKSVDVLKHYSPEDQQILKEALASAVFKEDGENAKIGRVMIHALNGMFIAEIGEFNLAEINPRATLEQAHAEQAALARELAVQTLEKENPELAAQKNFSDDRYRHYMSEIQAQMNVLNAERNGPSFWTDAPLERQKEVNDQVSVLNLMRFALHDAADLSIPDQAKYFAKLDSEPFPKTAEEMRIDIIHDPILEPVQIAALQETSVQTEPVQTEPVGTNGEQNSSETLIVMPQLTPEESEVSPSQLANLNENIIAINKEGDEIHAKNADIRAASEAQELININNALDSDKTISDRYIEFEKNIEINNKPDLKEILENKIQSLQDEIAIKQAELQIAKAELSEIRDATKGADFNQTDQATALQNIERAHSLETNVVNDSEQQKAIENNELKISVEGAEMTSEQQIAHMRKNFGFEEKTTLTMQKVEVGIDKKFPDLTQKDKDYLLNRLIGGFVYEGVKWDSTAGDMTQYFPQKSYYEKYGASGLPEIDGGLVPITHQEMFEHLGVSEQEYKALRYDVRIQNQICSGNFKEWGDSKNRQQDYLDAYNSAYGTNLSANEFGKTWDAQLQAIKGNGDFAHQSITTATILHEGSWHDAARLKVGNEERVDDMSGWLGDATIKTKEHELTKEKTVQFGADDYKADLDAANINHLIKKYEWNFNQTSNHYYNEYLANGNSRAALFTEHTSYEYTEQEIMRELGIENFTDLKQKQPDAYNFLMNLKARNHEMKAYE